MKHIFNNSGKNAGKVWQTIHKYGPLSRTMIMNNTHLNEKEFCLAVGWLARENKIWSDKHRYGLGDTNLTETIGANAGKIWKALDVWEKVDISAVAKLAEIPVADAYSALGWLAREDKIKMVPSAQKNSAVKIILE